MMIADHATKNFKIREFTCNCGCGYNVIDQRVIDMCQKIRDRIGIPVIVNSGCRCPEHNVHAGGVKNSYHVQGLAADISCKFGVSALLRAIVELYNEGEIPQLSYCIRYPTFIHIDCGKKRDHMWELRK